MFSIRSRGAEAAAGDSRKMKCLKACVTRRVLVPRAALRFGGGRRRSRANGSFAGCSEGGCKNALAIGLNVLRS
jgi:hypothetical protein